LLFGYGQLEGATPLGAEISGTGSRGEKLSEKQVKECALSTPAPEYPIEARRQKVTGLGIYELRVDTRTGHVKNVTIVLSTYSPILDLECKRALIRWRFKPGAIAKARLPILFTVRGPPQSAASKWVY
jgi:TonB family protein